MKIQSDEAQEFLKGIFISKAEFKLIKQKAMTIANLVNPFDVLVLRVAIKELNSILAQVEGAGKGEERGKEKGIKQEIDRYHFIDEDNEIICNDLNCITHNK